MRRPAGSLLAVLCFAALCAWALSQSVGPSCGPACRVECSIDTAAGGIDYRPTNYTVVLNGQDPVQSVPRVQQDLSPLADSEEEIKANLCSRDKQLALTGIQVTNYPASALATNLGPAIFVTARALAQLWVKDVTFSEFQFIQTCDNDGNAVTAGSKGKLVHTLKAFNYSEVMSHGSLYVLITGAAKVKDTLSESERNMRVFLSRVVNKLLFAATFVDYVVELIAKKFDGVLPKNVKRAIDKMRRTITSAKLDLECEVAYSAHPQVNGKGAKAGTKAFVDLRLDEDASRFMARKQYAIPYVGHPFDSGVMDQVTVIFDSEATSSAKAMGKRGDAVAMASSLTAFFTFVACKDERGLVDSQLVPFRIDASYAEDQLQQIGGSVVLDKYKEFVAEFNETYDGYMNQLTRDHVASDWESCVETKKKLDLYQDALTQILLKHSAVIEAAQDQEAHKDRERKEEKAGLHEND